MTDAPARRDWPDACPEPKPGLVVQPVGDETVVYDASTDTLHHLEPTAAAVWELLDGDRSARAVIAHLAGAYAVPEDVVHRDVLDLTAVLRERGLLAGSTAVRASTGRQPQPVPGGEFDLGGQPPPLPTYVTRPFRGLAHAFEIATNRQAVRDYLDEILADLNDSGNGARGRYEFIELSATRYLVYYQGQTVVATGRLDRALSVLLWHVNTEVVRRSTARYPLVHAAAAVWDGAAVLLPAAPESGKTTTVAGLIDGAGFGYLTDEAVAIDPETLVAQPYPKPLSIDRGSWDVLPQLRPAHSDWVTGQWQVPAGSIRPNTVAKAAPIRFVVEPAYDPDATTRLEPMARAAMLVRLADSTFDFQAAPERNLAVLARVVEQADCYRLPISELGGGIQLIKKLLTQGNHA